MGDFLHPGQTVGKRLLPHTVEFLEDVHPNNIFVIYHEGGKSDYSRGWKEINFKQLARAVDWSAWWLHDKIGNSNSCEVIALMASNDVRYSIFSLAAQKAGYAVKSIE